MDELINKIMLLLKLNNLVNPDQKTLTIIEIDINDNDLTSLLENIDYVFHLAAMTSVPLNIDNPEKCTKDNLITTIKLFNACKDNNVKKIVFSSSLSAYKDNTNMPVKK